MPGRRYIYFLAHAARDAAWAEQLYDLLSPDVPTFLASRCLLPGDDWDVELARAQRGALATVALIRTPVEPAYYFRAEIAAAIARQRREPDLHRLIPVYRDGRPGSPDDVPYGLELKHALDAAPLGLDGVAAELRRVAGILTARAEVPLPVRTAAAAATKPAPQAAVVQLYDCLARLLVTQLDIVAMYVAAPQEHLAPRTAPLATRALDLAQWAQQGGSPRLAQVRAAIRRVAPGVC